MQILCPILFYLFIRKFIMQSQADYSYYCKFNLHWKKKLTLCWVDLIAEGTGCPIKPVPAGSRRGNFGHDG